MAGIADFRLPIAYGHWKELPNHFFNRQSAIGNENLVSGCGYAALCYLLRAARRWLTCPGCGVRSFMTAKSS
jgi:hypothetical protein